MTAKKFTVFITLLIIIFGCSGDKPVEPSPPKPTVAIFSISPNDIVPPDSALVTWKTTLADSVKLFPTGQKLNPVDSGQIYLKPTVPTNYRLTAYNSAGSVTDSVMVTMSALAANITDFRINPDTVVVGDSSIITWSTNQADSLVLNNGVGRLNPTASGQQSIVLQNTAAYRAIAYSIYGNDTVTISVRVKKPTLVRALNGDYYKGIMGSSQVSPQIRYYVADAANNLLDGIWLNLRLLQGDGVLTPADSILTNAQGYADISYDFDGLLGHAVVSANFRGVDTADIIIRANTIIPGIGGQGQCVLLSELYSDVKNINGPPLSEEEDPVLWLNYANYEAIYEVVFVIQDTNHSHFADDDEHVYSIILTSGYPYKTKDSIGIGSTYSEIKSVYGLADSAFFSPEDTVNPPAIGVVYDSIGMLFYIDTVVGNPVDTNKAVFEIHMDDFISPPSPNRIAAKTVLNTGDKPVNYRRYRR
jgi:hypothetical protein